MAQLVDQEGTSTCGEAHEFERILRKASISCETIEKLVKHDFKTVHLLREIEIDQLPGLCKEFGIAAVSDEVKLRAMIRSLKPESPSGNMTPIIIDKEERLSLIQMSNKIKEIDHGLSLIGEATRNISENANKHRTNIRLAIRALHQALGEREAVLLSAVDEVERSKNSNLAKMGNELRAKKAECQQKLSECELKVAEPTKIYNLDARIVAIGTVAEEIEAVLVVSAKDEVIRKTEMNVILKNEPLLASISQLGSVASGPVPVLLSLTDNQSGSVSIKWKLEGRDSDADAVHTEGERGKLKIEWSETKTEDLTQFNGNYERSADGAVKWKPPYQQTKVKLGKRTATYVIRIRYYDGLDWSPPSAPRTVALTLKDSWDAQCLGANMTTTGQRIENTIASYRSAFGVRIVSKRVHSWTVRIDKITKTGWTLLGVWKSRYDTASVLNSNFADGKHHAYCLELNSGYLPDTARAWNWMQGQKRYCPQIKSGDVVKMTLDLNQGSLCYEVNGKEHGKAWDVGKESYRLACMLYKNDKMSLLSYECRA